MQQPMQQQHEQIGGQQQQAMSQQMVLCPVRLVYETQILVQPGDHIQPNQTFFINTQNPPPWMQNSLQSRPAISNQPVIYVQQMPNNIISSVQQPMDQNQMYLQQNFANFQLQQQLLAQNQERRPTMQITNLMPNMVQNIQTSTANDKASHQNGQMSSNTQIVPVNRQMQNHMNHMEVQRQVMMRPQIHQQTNIQRPTMTMNQVQNMQQQTLTMPNIVQTQNVNHMMPNMGRPPSNVNIVRTPVPNNVVSVQPVPKIREITPSEANKPMSPLTNAPGVRNFVPNYYRPIQPRPQTNHNVGNTQKIPQHIPVQTVQTTPMYKQDRNNSHQTTNNSYPTLQQQNNSNNRKRKSESPDEIQKKMAVGTIKVNHPQQPMTITKLVNEIGTNTSPVHKPKINTVNKVSNPMPANTDSILENIIKGAMVPVPEKDKLIRNTVYTQARGRVLQDKVEEIKPHVETKTELVKMLGTREVEPVKVYDKVESLPEDVNKSVQTIESMANVRKNDTIKVEKQNQLKENPPKIEILVKEDSKATEVVRDRHIGISIETKPNDNTKEILNGADKAKHIQIVVNYTTNPDIDNAPVEDKIDNKEDLKSKTVVDINKKAVEEDKCKEEKVEATSKTIQRENINILTHVLDGYVIQESNIAFPIRKPLKEKILHTNLKSENEEKDSIRESIKEELKNKVDIPLLPFHYLMKAKEEKEVVEEIKEEIKTIEDKPKDDPFCELQCSTVKDWTVSDLCNHLLKFNWKETISLFQEHEIDGESLLLVSKQQLITIGVKEEHADTICEFSKR